jgi:hypothetical protein
MPYLISHFKDGHDWSVKIQHKTLAQAKILAQRAADTYNKPYYVFQVGIRRKATIKPDK